MKRNKKIPKNVTIKDSKKIESLFNYWKRLSIKNTFSVKEYVDFLKKNSESLKLFDNYRPNFRDKFITSAEIKSLLVIKSEDFLKMKSLPENYIMLMKDFARNYISRFKKQFEFTLINNIKNKSTIDDSQVILKTIDKLSYRWAAGIIISNYIASVLIIILEKEKITYKNDDILTLYSNIKLKSKNNNIVKFMNKNYRRFEDADKTRNRCAHITEGEPTKIEIDQSIALARLLNKKLDL